MAYPIHNQAQEPGLQQERKHPHPELHRASSGVCHRPYRRAAAAQAAQGWQRSISLAHGSGVPHGSCAERRATTQRAAGQQKQSGRCKPRPALGGDGARAAVCASLQFFLLHEGAQTRERERQLKNSPCATLQRASLTRVHRARWRRTSSRACCRAPCTCPRWRRAARLARTRRRLLLLLPWRSLAALASQTCCWGRCCSAWRRPRWACL